MNVFTKSYQELPVLNFMKHVHAVSILFIFTHD